MLENKRLRDLIRTNKCPAFLHSMNSNRLVRHYCGQIYVDHITTFDNSLMKVDKVKRTPTVQDTMFYDYKFCVYHAILHLVDTLGFFQPANISVAMFINQQIKVDTFYLPARSSENHYLIANDFIQEFDSAQKSYMQLSTIIACNVIPKLYGYEI